VAINFNQARQRARDVSRKNDLKAVQKALELYKDEQFPQEYPETADIVTAIESGGYMEDFPIDPREKGLEGSWVDYIYERTTSLEYTLITCLENDGDVDKDATLDEYCDGVSEASYTLTEP
jgi:hypothetical protein